MYKCNIEGQYFCISDSAMGIINTVVVANLDISEVPRNLSGICLPGASCEDFRTFLGGREPILRGKKKSAL